MDLTTIKDLAEVGGTVILTVMLWLVWKRLNEVTDRLIDIADEVRLNRIDSVVVATKETTKP